MKTKFTIRNLIVSFGLVSFACTIFLFIQFQELKTQTFPDYLYAKSAPTKEVSPVIHLVKLLVKSFLS